MLQSSETESPTNAAYMVQDGKLMRWAWSLNAPAYLRNVETRSSITITTVHTFVLVLAMDVPEQRLITIPPGSQIIRDADEEVSSCADFLLMQLTIR